MSVPTTSIFLNSSEPAPPTGQQNVKFKSDGGSPQQSITAYDPIMEGDSGSGGGGSASSGSDDGYDYSSVLGFANGGDPPIGRPSIVGENGPELIVPKRASTVIPNGKFGSGSMHYHDFRGANFSHTEQANNTRKYTPAKQRAISKAVEARWSKPRFTATGHKHINIRENGKYRVRFRVGKKTVTIGQTATLQDAIALRDSYLNGQALGIAA